MFKFEKEKRILAFSFKEVVFHLDNAGRQGQDSEEAQGQPGAGHHVTTIYARSQCFYILRLAN